MPDAVQELVDHSAEPAVRGFLHLPAQPNGDSLLLTHGAGANCQSKLLLGLADGFAGAGFLVLCYDLPFRQVRRFGPPPPGAAAQDRQGIKRALDVLHHRTSGRLFAGGHSYGGRQSSMLVAEKPDLVNGLLLLSYPLHPPRKPEQLRTAHLPKLVTPVMFVHGSRDPFATVEEMQTALALIPARHALLEVEEAGHELLAKNSASGLSTRVVQEFVRFLSSL